MFLLGLGLGALLALIAVETFRNNEPDMPKEGIARIQAIKNKAHGPDVDWLIDELEKRL